MAWGGMAVEGLEVRCVTARAWRGAGGWMGFSVAPACEIPRYVRSQRDAFAWNEICWKRNCRSRKKV